MGGQEGITGLMEVGVWRMLAVLNSRPPAPRHGEIVPNWEQSARVTDVCFTRLRLGGLCGGEAAQVIRSVIWTSDHLSAAVVPEATKLPVTYQYMQHPWK